MLRGIHVRRLLRDELTKDLKVLGHFVLLTRESDIERSHSSSEMRRALYGSMLLR